MRHGYSMHIWNGDYTYANSHMDYLINILDNCDILWLCDADVVITDMTKKIEDLKCLGPNVTICEEPIVEWNRINCGSVIFKNTSKSRSLLTKIAVNYDKWHGLPCGWQSWLQLPGVVDDGTVTIAPQRSFNSVVWNFPGGKSGLSGYNWDIGDFVYHPCGIYPLELRYRCLEEVVTKGIKR